MARVLIVLPTGHFVTLQRLANFETQVAYFRSFLSEPSPKVRHWGRGVPISEVTPWQVIS
jgi:hypothetical protein